MTNALPDYLRDIPSAGIADRALEGIGSSQPPHISIRGNEFTLVDQGGEEIPVDTKYLDVNIVDISDVMCKMYRDTPWVDGANDPPTCWSANGIAPSKESQKPQARTCAECKWNERGSAVSKLTGALTKACRDEKYTAVFPIGPNLPGDMLFQLKITPGSFENWGAFINRNKSNGLAVEHIVTRLTFAPKKNGVLEFTPSAYIGPESAELLKRALASKATDVLVGRNDVPRTAALPAPEQERTIGKHPGLTAPYGAEQGSVSPDPYQQVAQSVFTPNPAPGLSNPASAAGNLSTNFSPSANADAPAVADPPTRKRRTKAEMEAAKGQPDPNAAAPFRPQASPPNGPAFGMAQPSPISQELNKTLDGLFGPAPGK